MPNELTWLGWAIVLGLVHVLVAAALGTWQRGLRWTSAIATAQPSR